MKVAWTVGDLIDDLRKYPRDFQIHLDLDTPGADEGDRTVRLMDGADIQAGFKAVALYGMTAKDTAEVGMIEADDTLPERIADAVEKEFARIRDHYVSTGNEGVQAGAEIMYEALKDRFAPMGIELIPIEKIAAE